MTPRKKGTDERLRTVGYARVSKEEAGQRSVSIAAQKERIRACCVSRGFNLLRIYSDVASGRNMKRPGLMRLLADAKKGMFEAVVFAKLDRLSRRMLDWALLQEQMHHQNIALVSISESLDDTTAVGRMMGNIIASFAQLEREVLSERTKAALDYKKAHLKVYGPTPFGFRRVQDRLLPDGKALKTVHEVFRMRRKGASLRAIGAALQEKGVLSPHGRPEWPVETVRVILRNAPLYGQVLNGLL